MTEMGEVWRDVPSVPGLLVSSEGRVMRAPHRKSVPNGGVRSYGGTPHWGVWNKQIGRFIVVVNRRTFKIHRLVAEAFHGPPPFEGAVVMHKDENSANNRAANLTWGTQKKNLNAPGFLEYCRRRTGEANPYVKGKRRKLESASESGDTEATRPASDTVSPSEGGESDE